MQSEVCDTTRPMEWSETDWSACVLVTVFSWLKHSVPHKVQKLLCKP